MMFATFGKSPEVMIIINELIGHFAYIYILKNPKINTLKMNICGKFDDLGYFQ